MSDFITAYSKVKAAEGFYANTPGDKGGETYMGIARNIFPNEEIWTIVDYYKRQNGGSLANNTKLPGTEEIVQDFYYRLWSYHRLGEVQDQKVANLLFDFIVHSGTTAIKIIQRTVGVNDDGRIGPVTLNAINAQNPSTLINAVSQARVGFLTNLATQPGQEQFYSNWIARASGFFVESPGITAIGIAALLGIGYFVYRHTRST